MITLPNLVVSDIGLASGDATAKTPGSAEDFLALLTGALTPSADAAGCEKRLPLAAEDAASLRDSNTKGQSLTEWLVEQEAARASADAGVETGSDTGSDAQTLLSSLAAHLKRELTSDKKETPTRGEADETLNEEAIGSLSALMAMLPAPTQASASVNTDATGDRQASLTAPLKQAGSHAERAVDLNAALASQPATEARALPADAAFVIPGKNAQAESTPSPTAPGAAPSPVAAPNSAAPAGAAVASVHAQLGTPDWQQNISQHITLFTRQGQQTAELRLHPESLGQVNITLKVEDNLAQIQMASPHSHVRAALEAALPVLRSQLENSGIQLGQSNISGEGFAGQQQQSSSQQAFAPRADTRHADDGDDGDLLSVPAALHAAARGDNAVDIFA